MRTLRARRRRRFCTSPSISCAGRETLSRRSSTLTFSMVACMFSPRRTGLLWCERRDSNSHACRRQNLNLVRLPIPPLSPSAVHAFYNKRAAPFHSRLCRQLTRSARMTPDEYCQQRVAARGSSLYYSVLFLPAEQRRGVVAVHAFSRELHDAVDQASDPGVARAKLAYWRGELHAAMAGSPQHPVARALAAVAHAD